MNKTMEEAFEDELLKYRQDTIILSPVGKAIAHEMFAAGVAHGEARN